MPGEDVLSRCQSRSREWWAVGLSPHRQGSRVGLSQLPGLLDTDLKCLLRDSVLHSLQHIHVGMWLRVKENTEREEQERPVAAARRPALSSSVRVGGLKYSWRWKRAPSRGRPTMPHHTREHRICRLQNSGSNQDTRSQRVVACTSAPQ